LIINAGAFPAVVALTTINVDTDATIIEIAFVASARKSAGGQIHAHTRATFGQRARIKRLARVTDGMERGKRAGTGSASILERETGSTNITLVLASVGETRI